MRFAVVGAGAVGGYYGAMLARQGHDVSFIARGAHLEAIRQRGLRVVGPLGDFTVQTPAESDSARVGQVDAVVLAVKTYDNDTAIPLLEPLVGPSTTVLTLQNGVDSAEEVAAVIGERATLGGATYIATAVEAPGLIRQTGTHRRVVFGEYFDATGKVTDRVRAIEQAMVGADIEAEAVADARPVIWEKFTYLAPFAAFTGAARLPIGPLWADPHCRTMFLAAVDEVSRRRPRPWRRAAGRSARAARRLHAEAAALDALVAAHRLVAGQAHRSRSAAGQRRSPRPRQGRADADHGGAVRRAQSSEHGGRNGAMRQWGNGAMLAARQALAVHTPGRGQKDRRLSLIQHCPIASLPHCLITIVSS